MCVCACGGCARVCTGVHGCMNGREGELEGPTTAPLFWPILRYGAEHIYELVIRLYDSLELIEVCQLSTPRPHFMDMIILFERKSYKILLNTALLVSRGPCSILFLLFLLPQSYFS